MSYYGLNPYYQTIRPTTITYTVLEPLSCDQNEMSNLLPNTALFLIGVLAHNNI